MIAPSLFPTAVCMHARSMGLGIGEWLGTGVDDGAGVEIVVCAKTGRVVAKNDTAMSVRESVIFILYIEKNYLLDLYHKNILIHNK